jgi:hypothetical protein
MLLCLTNILETSSPLSFSNAFSIFITVFVLTNVKQGYKALYNYLPNNEKSRCFKKPLALKHLHGIMK